MNVTEEKKPVESPFYTAAEVAGMLRVSTRTIHALCKKGAIRYKMVGREYRIYRDSADNYIRESEA